jgi:hypothetical protein
MKMDFLKVFGWEKKKQSKSMEKEKSMVRTVYSFRFNDGVSLSEIEDSLLLSVFAVESLYGRSRIKLDASFCLEKKKRACVVDASTEIGCHIARIFTGFLICEFGEDAFKVERLGEAISKGAYANNKNNERTRR